MTAPRIFAIYAKSGWALASLSFLMGGIIFSLKVWGRQDSSAPLSARPCNASGRGDTTTKKPNKQKKLSRPGPQNDTGNACVEAAGSAIHIQEQLQSFVRQQRWLVSNEGVSETTWTFDVGF